MRINKLALKRGGKGFKSGKVLCVEKLRPVQRHCAQNQNGEPVAPAYRAERK